MVVSTKDIYELCCVIAKQEKLSVCVTEATKAGLITGGCTFLMACTIGPLAIIPAATLSGIVASYLTKQYVPLYKILSDMSEADKEKLTQHMLNVIQQLEITDAVALIAIASQARSPPYMQVLGQMGNYFDQQW